MRKRPPATRYGLYRTRLSETGNPLSTNEHTVGTQADAKARVATAAATPLDKIERAWRRLTSKTQCLGDALVELLTLPPNRAESELVL